MDTETKASNAAKKKETNKKNAENKKKARDQKLVSINLNFFICWTRSKSINYDLL